MEFRTVLGENCTLINCLSNLLLYNKPPQSLVSESTTVIYSGHKYSIWAGLSRDYYLHYLVSAGTAKIGASGSPSKMAHSQGGKLVLVFIWDLGFCVGPGSSLWSVWASSDHSGPVPRASFP